MATPATPVTPEGDAAPQGAAPEGDAALASKLASKSLMIGGRPESVVTMSQRQVDDWTRECAAKFPKDRKYQVVYADPPWQYQRMGKVEGQTAYPTMPLRDLKALPVAGLCDATCVLFMWVTNPLLETALEVIKAWGFTYKTVFKVWCKRSTNGAPVTGCGWWSRPSTEMVLVATRGRGYMKWKQTCREPQEFAGLRRGHSEKPDEVRDAVRAFFDRPEGLDRIELFARSLAPGFDAWGLEVPGYFRAHGPATHDPGAHGPATHDPGAHDPGAHGPAAHDPAM